MTDYLRVAGNQSRDWRNYDALGRPPGIAWPWPETARPALHERMRRVLARIAGLVASEPPERQPRRAESRP